MRENIFDLIGRLLTGDTMTGKQMKAISDGLKAMDDEQLGMIVGSEQEPIAEMARQVVVDRYNR